MSTTRSAKDVIETMMQQDRFSQLLGMKILEASEGHCKITLTVREEMVNGLGIVHGGIAFSLADSAFAFACNSRNNRSVALDTSINFVRAIYPGDILTADATEMHNGRSTGLYHIRVTDQGGNIVALFKGTCFRTGKAVVGTLGL